MIPMTLEEIATVVGGTAHGEATVSGPAFLDSRAVEPGGLFVAVVGEHADGHEYAESAVAAGAAAVLGSRPTGVPTVVVDDVVAALGTLARHVVDRLSDTTVLALTGSQGKTGTKDYLAQLLAGFGPTVATAGNYNNEIGVPLTVLRATPETRFLIVEMGARGIGHIGYLCGIAPPRVAAVINVGTAHLSEFGTREAIAQAKGEIAEAVPADGRVVLHADDPLVAAIAERTAAPVFSFGTEESASVRFHDVDLDDLGRPNATLTFGDQWPDGVAGRSVGIALGQIGPHQVANAAAALAMGLLAVEDSKAADPVDAVDTAVAALGRATSQSRWRMEAHDRADGVTVVNDTYNANPASMGAALDALAGIKARSGRRTLAVLGEMKELGESSPEAHAGVGEDAARHGVDVLLVIGEPAQPMLEGAARVTSWSGTGVFVEDRTAALAWLRENVIAGDVVLVKASRGAALEIVAEGLLTEPGDGETD